MSPLLAWILFAALCGLAAWGLWRLNLWSSRQRWVNAARPEAPFPVRVKKHFLARSEQRFFEVLREVTPPGYLACPNVRLTDLFLISPGDERTEARLRDKHVDFLLVRLSDSRPLAALELDGPSHDTPEQRYRDAVKDAVCDSGGLPLLRFSTGAPISASQLRQALKPFFT